MKITKKGIIAGVLALLLTLAAGVLALLITGGDENPVPQTPDIEKTANDTGEVTVNEQNQQSTVKDVIIADLQRTIKALEAGAGDSKELSRRLKAANERVGELERLTVLNTQTKFTTEADLKPVTPETLSEKLTHWIGLAEEKDGWYSIQSTIDLNTQKISHDVSVKDTFDIAEFTEGGVRKVQVFNLNPYTVTEPGTNVFELQPVTQPAAKKQGRVRLALTAGWNVTYVIKDKKFATGPGISGGVAFTF